MGRVGGLKLPPFSYEAPGGLDEALGLLAEHGDEAKVLAGGQSLIPLLALRLARPSVLIDLNGVDGLGVIATDAGADAVSVSIGAMVRERAAERSGAVQRSIPLLAEALPLIGHDAIRTRGTIGGSLAHADPAGELPAVARALDATFRVASRARGERTIPAAGWFQGYFTTALEPDEILLDITFPTAEPNTGTAFLEVSRRHGDFAMVGVAAAVTVTDGAITAARIALSGMADTPVRATAAEDGLRGATPSPEAFTAAGQAAVEGLSPPADLHGTSAYRSQVGAVLVRRALTQAAARIEDIR